MGPQKKGLSKETKVNRNEALMPTMTPHKCSCDHYLLKSLLLHGTEAKSRTRCYITELIRVKCHL